MALLGLQDIKNLRQEIEILRQLRHEHIIQMLDAFETKTDFCVVTGERGFALERSQMLSQFLTLVVNCQQLIAVIQAPLPVFGWTCVHP